MKKGCDGFATFFIIDLYFLIEKIMFLAFVLLLYFCCVALFNDENTLHRLNFFLSLNSFL